MRKITSLFLFLILMLNLLMFFPAASGVEFDLTLTGFETYNVLAESGSDTYTSFAKATSDEFYISNAWAETGTKSLYMDRDSVSTNMGNIMLLDNYTYISSITLEFRCVFISTGTGTSKLDINLLNWEGDEILRIQFETTAADNHYIDFIDGELNENNLFTHLGSSSITRDKKLTIEHDSLNEMTVSVSGNDSVTDSLLVAEEWVNFSGIRFEVPLNTGTNEIQLYIDDLKITFMDELPEDDEENEINVILRDINTNEQLKVFGNSFPASWLPLYAPSVRTRIYSDLWPGDYDNTGDFGTTINLNNLTFVQGSYHFINFSNMLGYVGTDYVSYFNSSNYLQLYYGQTYTIYLSDAVTGYGGYSNCQDTGYGENSYDYDFGDPGHRQLCTDKEWYTQGESINIRYVAPDPQWLYDNGRPSGDYFIWIYDVNNLGWLWWETDGGDSADNGDYLDDWAVSLDNNYHYLHWDYDPGETFGYKTVAGGIDHYKMYIGHGGGGLFGLDIKLTEGPEFYIQGGDYAPHGNITSISPSEPMLGQFVTIGFEANNNGYLTIKNLLAPGETEQVITNFQKFDGIETVTRQIFDFGSYELNLYVSSGIEFEIVDTDTFDITDINGSFGDFGFGIEFLTVEPERAIAGYDIVFINYRSLDETGVIKVIDARGQTTSYGTVVGTKRGVLNITLPNHASIGEWNITLTTANNTLYSSFQVIAEENNWVEFYSNVYFESQQFELKIKHDKKVELVFYKDGQAIGTDWYLDVGILPGGIYPVPTDKIIISSGTWKVEMWQVNNFVKIKKLAEDTCVVIEDPPGSLTEGGNQNIFQILTAGASSFADGEFGLAFMAIIFIIVIIIILAQYKIKNDTIFFGGILMALFMAYIGWLPVWIVVLAIVISGILFSNAFSKKLGIGS